MQKLLSLPPNLIDSFHQLEEVNHTDWFCTSDPVGSKLGSGGGTTWLLQACHQAFAPEETFSKWIGNEKDFAACGRTKPPLARLCSFGQNTDSHTGFQLGERTKAGTESAVAATSAIRKNHEAGSERLEHADSQRRRIYPFGKTAARHPGSRCRMLWFMGESFTGYSPRSICIGPQEAGSARLHVAETFFRGIGRIIKDPSFPDGYRYMDIK